MSNGLNEQVLNDYARAFGKHTPSHEAAATLALAMSVERLRVFLENASGMKAGDNLHDALYDISAAAREVAEKAPRE